MLTLITLSSIVYAQDFIVDGNSVYTDTVKFKINVTPHTLTQSGYIYIDVLNKQYNGKVNFFAGFELDSIKYTSLEVYNPHDVTTQEEYTCDFDVNYTADYFWCYDETNGTVFFEHSYLTGNISSKTAYWNVITTVDYSKVNKPVTRIDHNYDDKDYWLIVENIMFPVGVTKKARIYIEIPRVSIFDKNTTKYDTKYNLGFFPSIYPITKVGIRDAILNNHFFYLDPWTRGTSYLAVYYTCNEDSTTLTDYNGNDATTTNTESTIDGIISRGQNFSSIYKVDYDLISIPSSNYTDALEDFTYQLWIKPRTLTSAASLFRLIEDNQTGLISTCFLTSTSNAPEGRLGYYDGSFYYSDIIINIDEWNHIVYTRKGDKIHIYINGVNDSNNPHTVSSVVLPSSGFNVGTYKGAPKLYTFQGIIDEIGIWRDDLSGPNINCTVDNSSEVCYLYAGGVPTLLQQPPPVETTCDITSDTTITSDVDCTDGGTFIVTGNSHVVFENANLITSEIVVEDGSSIALDVNSELIV